MTKPLRTQFVIADGSRARLVARSDETRDFVTTKILRAASRPRAPKPLGVVFESSAGRPSGTGHEHVKSKRQAFAREVVEMLSAEARRSGFERLAVVAPARTLSAICEALPAPMRAKVAQTLAKDLTKTPDHELGHWLTSLEM